MNSAPPRPTRTWPAYRWPEVPGPSAPAERPAEWLPLRCTWRPAESSLPSAAGRARIGWTPAALHVEAEFSADRPHNRATRLNERTWETGDVCEIFVQVEGAGDYLEVHVTPENQRLQLRWPPGGLARVRARQQPLEAFLVEAQDWVASSTRVEEGRWFTRLTVPAVRLGIPELHPIRVLRAAVCRYHFRPGHPQPELSSTASFATEGFHQPDAWSAVTLVPP